MNEIILEIIKTSKDSSTLLEAELALETVFQRIVGMFLVVKNIVP